MNCVLALRFDSLTEFDKADNFNYRDQRSRVHAGSARVPAISGSPGVGTSKPYPLWQSRGALAIRDREYTPAPLVYR